MQKPLKSITSGDEKRRRIFRHLKSWLKNDAECQGLWKFLYLSVILMMAWECEIGMNEWKGKKMSGKKWGWAPHWIPKHTRWEQGAELNHAQIKVEVLCNVKGTKRWKKGKKSRFGKSLTKNQWMKGRINSYERLFFFGDYQNEIERRKSTRNIKKVNRQIRLLFGIVFLLSSLVEKIRTHTKKNYISRHINPTCLPRLTYLYQLH